MPNIEPKSLYQPAKQYEVYPGLPKFRIEKPAFIHYPRSTQHGGVFNQQGQFIPGSGLERGLSHSVQRFFGGGTIDVAASSKNFIEEPHLYLGGLFSHFGHCLLETLSRIWPLLTGAVDKNISLAVIAYPDQDVRMLKAWLVTLGFPKPQITVVHSVCKFAELIVPEPAVIIRRLGFNDYATVLRSAFLSAHFGVEKPRLAIIYLSRKKLPLNVRTIIGESYIEDYLRSAGVTVLYPEELSLTEQIQAFQGCHTVIGYIGSSFHHLLFCEKNITAIYLCANPPISTYPMIDEMVGAKAVYFKNTILPELSGFSYINLHNEPILPNFEELFNFFERLGIYGTRPVIACQALIIEFMSVWLRNTTETLARSPVANDLRASKLANAVEQNSKIFAQALTHAD